MNHCAIAAGCSEFESPFIKRNGDTNPAFARTSKTSLCDSMETGIGPSSAVTTQSEQAMSRIMQLEQSINI
jgi:hypothetical protein